jgi:hypothetical protein
VDDRPRAEAVRSVIAGARNAKNPFARTPFTRAVVLARLGEDHAALAARDDGLRRRDPNHARCGGTGALLVPRNRKYRYIREMKTSIDLPDELYRQVKARSALEGKTVREVATSLFAAYAAGRAVEAPASRELRGESELALYEERMAALRASLAEAGVTSGLVEQLQRDRR